MLGWLVRRRLAALQREFNYDPRCVLDVFEASPRAFLRISWISALAAHREEASKEGWYAAKLVATLAEDCNACTQLVITMAERGGESPVSLQSVLEGDKAEMPRMRRSDSSAPRRFCSDVAGADRLRAEVTSHRGARDSNRWALPSLPRECFQP